MDEEPASTSDAGAPARRPPRISFRAAATWGLGLVATLSIAAAAAAAGIVLTVFGLGGIALATVALLVLAGATVWRRGMLSLAVIALALALPAAWAASGDNRLVRSHGTLIARPGSPVDVSAKPYRLGVGPVLVDLRAFRAPAGSTTRIAARAEAGKLVVALPRDRCFNLDVRFRADPIENPAAVAVRAVRTFASGSDPGGLVSTSGLGLTARASKLDSDRAGLATQVALASGATTTPYDLLAFNRWATEAGRYRRAPAEHLDTPTLRLDLRSSQQIVIRDYPDDVGPLTLGDFDHPGRQIGGMLWPQEVQAPLAPTERGWSGRSSVRTAANHARWVRWERELISYAKAQARRAAGPCATQDEIRARGFSFLTQPETLIDGVGHAERLVGTGPNRVSPIKQRAARNRFQMVQVEVDGLGATRAIGLQDGAGYGTTPVGP